jgi:DNA gyrase subunit A
VVGEVLGKFHPHGDTAVYEALVRMVQTFVSNVPLIAGHGNFGSVDDDPPAAMRYTECKLAPIAMQALLEDIDLNTVDFVNNFDGNEREPVVLPAKLPVLLLNGATGIAVGMATNIPPHNLRELVDALVAMIDDPAIATEQLAALLPAPDFPTGGTLMGMTGVRDLYETGQGTLVIRAKTHVELLTQKGKQPRNAIVVSELPYMVNKATLLEKIASLVNDKKLEGISDLRDESDRDGIRMVIELKRDAVPAVVLNNLFKKTTLQTSFSGNMVALTNNGKQPIRLTLKDILRQFISFRFSTVRRRTEYQLKAVQERDHIVQGMTIALGRVNEVIELIKNSKDSADAQRKLTSVEYGLSAPQADAVLALRLSRLTNMETDKLKKEHEELLREISSLSLLMTDDHRVHALMKDEMKALKTKYGRARQTELGLDEGALTDESLVANDRSIIVVTQSGYVKRMPVAEFEAQGRGTRGKAGARMSGEHDMVEHFFACNDHDTLLFVSERGVVYGVRAFQVPVASRTAKGVPLPQILPISNDEHVSSILPVNQFNDDQYLVLLTRKVCY